MYLLLFQNVFDLSLYQKVDDMSVFSNKGNCRGDGKYYMLFDCGAVAPARVASYASDGRELPSRLVSMDAGEFVVILADFTINQELIFFDSDSGVIERKVISPKAMAIESKANGLLHKELCARIRNIDRSGMKCLSSITCQRLIPCKGGFIVRGVVATTELLTVDKVVAYNEAGKVVGESRSLAAGAVASEAGVLSFSVTVSDVVDTMCLAALDDNGEQIGAFVNFKKDLFHGLCDASVALYCNAYDDARYQTWLSSHRLTSLEAAAQRKRKFVDAPLFSVVVPLYKTPMNFFVDMVESVVAQTYSNWELILVNSTPEEAALHAKVLEYARLDARIRYVDLEGNLGITENTNRGVAVARGDYVCYFDHDDVLEPDILFEYAMAIESNSNINLLYCDEDKLLPDGSFAMPSFKPDFSLDMVRDNNYICHLLTVRRELLSQIEQSNKELDGAQDHAMVLKIAELGGEIHHVAKILYHWRISETSTAGNSDSKPYATVAGVKAVQQHLDRVGLAAKVSNSHGRAFRYSPSYLVGDQTVCSIIVATRGEAALIRSFIESINATNFKKIELVFVCAGEKVDELVASASGSRFPFRSVTMDTEFSMAAWRNAGAEAAAGDVLVFAHDDIRPADSNWLDILAGFALREDVGAVGTMTCDEDGVIQQAGLSFVGDQIVYLSKGMHRTSTGYLFYPLTVRDVAAVSGACIAVSARNFKKLKGFDESYQLDFSDVDFCFRSAAQGLKVVYTPEAMLFHAATIESGLPFRNRSHRHFEDKAVLLGKWSNTFSHGDKWFSPHFSAVSKEAELYKLGGLDQMFV